LVLIERTAPTISVVVPTHDGAATLAKCLGALSVSSIPPLECIVVDDGSSDASAMVARQFGAQVFATNAGNRGPAAARNLGALHATGDVLLFLDADVCVRPDTLQRIADAFAANPAMDALIGSYDDSPSEPNFCSQYRNLMHCFFHQTARSDASTFWTGCGAIRRQTFFEHSGFDEKHRHPSMEDVEFGYRLTQSGRRIVLDSKIQVTHAKKWTVLAMLKTDILNRGIPWTRLILRYRRMPNDLNLKWSQRASVPAAWLIVALILSAIFRAFGEVSAIFPSDFWIRTMLIASVSFFVVLNLPFYRFLAQRRGLQFSGLVIPLHLCFHLLNGVSFLAGVLVHTCSEMLERFSVVPAESGGAL
jgi:glycosyltransferase involved in cell wall biosynthesis